MRRIVLFATCLLPLAGCLSMDETPEDSREIPTSGFVRGSVPADVRPSVIEVPATEFQAPTEVSTDTQVDVAPNGDLTTTTSRTISTANPDGKAAKMADGAKVSEALPPGQRWPVDQLVGQINGKPLYAEAFLRPREDRIRRIVAMPDANAARNEMKRLIDEAFDQFVNNELVISEAESIIPDEAKEGLLAWMRDLQEQEIAERGGTRSEAQRSIEQEFPGTTIEDFTKRQTREYLAADLMAKRIRPRTIVSWRDVERLYMKNYEAFNPLPTLRVARIALVTGDAAKVERVKEMFASGKSFAEVAESLQLANGGFWREFKLGPQGIDGVPDLVDDVKARIKGLKVGVVDGPVEKGVQISWLTLLPSQQAPQRSIFEPQLQLQLRRQLEGERSGMERYRYLASLRTRWIAEDLTIMRARIMQFAIERYFRGPTGG